VGQEPGSITIPFSKEQQNWLWQFSETWQNALANFLVQLNEHFPTSKVLHFVSTHSFVFPHWIQEDPIPGVLTLFTDASGKGMAAYYSTKDHKVKQTFFCL
jgi:hypothetical protein